MITLFVIYLIGVLITLFIRILLLMHDDEIKDVWIGEEVAGAIVWPLHLLLLILFVILLIIGGLF